MNIIFRTAIIMALLSVMSFAKALALPESFLEKASPKVKELVIKNNLEVVDYSYVLKAIGDGTRKNANALIIDARPMKKYQIAHIPSALALPDSKFEKIYKESFKTISKNKELIIYCGGYKCAKSPKVAKMFIKKGHTNVKVYAAGMPEWKKKTYVEIDTNVAKAIFDKKSQAIFIDARPYGKFMGSSIIGAIGVPDTKFEAYTKFMPNDKKAMLITFCGGYACHKSHSIANKLIKMGYTNVKVYAAGFPAWKKAKYPITGAVNKLVKNTSTKNKIMSDSGILKKGLDTGTVDGEWFKKNLNKISKDIILIDVRDAKDFKNGTLKGAINIHTEKMKAKEIAKVLPKNKDVVFFCGTGTRAMEAREFLSEIKYSGLNKVWYFDAEVDCDKNNNCKIKANEPIGI